MEVANYLVIASLAATIILPALIVAGTAFLGYVFFNSKKNKDEDE
ncbi:MAG: hypothetical protein RR539_05210 [Clostridium sp.]